MQRTLYYYIAMWCREALEIGRDMNAGHTVLTHFSQRSDVHVPAYDAQQFPNTIIA